MHELSIALSLVESAEEELDRQGGGVVRAVWLRIGPLSGVVKEALSFSYDLAVEGTRLEGSSLIIEDVPVRLRCENCGAESGRNEGEVFCCATCSGRRCRVVSGDELELAAMEVESVPAAVG